MGILHDQVFIQYLFSNGRSPFTPDYDDIDDFSWCDCNVRLTAQGHDFLAALRQKNIWKAVKEDLMRISVIAIARFGLFRSPDPAVSLSSYFYSK